MRAVTLVALLVCIPLSAWSQALAPVLARHGINLTGFLQLDGSTLAAGGVNAARGFDGQYLLDFSTTLDTEKLVGWPGGTLRVDVETHSGPNVMSQLTSSIQDPDNQDAYSFTAIERAWYRQMTWQGKLQLQVGLMYVDDQFDNVPYGHGLISLPFTSGSAINTFVMPSYPKGSVGGDVFLFPGDGIYAGAGVFNDHSTELTYDPGGSLWIGELGWHHPWHGLPFHVKVGAWRDTGRFRPYQPLPGNPTLSAAGVYLEAGQQLWRPHGYNPSCQRGIAAFVQLGTAPAALAPIDRHGGGGVVWTGPLASRPADQLGFGFSDGLLSAEGGFLHGFENELEAYYRLQATKSLTIEPDVEFWQHPGGMGTPNALLFQLRLQYNFSTGPSAP